MYVAIIFINFVDYISPETLISFLYESLLMKSFNHPNVLDVIGVGFHNGFPFMVLPFMVNGDLKIFLKSKRQKSTVVDHLPKVCYFLSTNVVCSSYCCVFLKSFLILTSYLIFMYII